MYKYNKIHAHKSTGWKKLTKESIFWYLFYPRWWNPLFWILVFFAPLLVGLTCIFTKTNKDNYLSSFFYGVLECSIEISQFFREYKV